jgi:hypothetical protein
MVKMREPGRPRMMGADNADAATPGAAPESVAKARRPRPPKKGARTIAQVTLDMMIHEFDEARLLAISRGQAAAAVTATLAKARLAGLLNEKGESTADPPAKFDGNYAEAARRIALVLRLANEQTASGQKLLPQHAGDHSGFANEQTASGQTR